MKGTILIPTDFSNNALVATRYALKLAALLNADVHILHSFTPFVSSFQSLQTNIKDAARAKEVAERGMKDFLEKLSEHNTADYPFETSLIEGNLLSTVKKIIAEKGVELVVMGTHGASETRRDLLGSNTYDVAKSIEIPLLIVPEHTPDFSLNNIVFFTDYQLNDFKVLDSLISILGEERKPCSLVHIAEGALDEQKDKLDSWVADLAHTCGYAELRGHVVAKRERMAVVNETIEELNADLCLLTLVEGRSFFEKLFRKSLARDIIINPKIPVLITK